MTEQALEVPWAAPVDSFRADPLPAERLGDDEIARRADLRRSGETKINRTERHQLTTPPGFEEFVIHRGASLQRLASVLLPYPCDTEAVVEEVLARALLKWPRIQRSDDPAGYVNLMLIDASTSPWRCAIRKNPGHRGRRKSRPATVP